MLVGRVSSIPLCSLGRLVRCTSTAWIRMTRRVFRRHTAQITTGFALSKPPTIQAISYAATRTFSRWPNLPFGEATAWMRSHFGGSDPEYGGACTDKRNPGEGGPPCRTGVHY